MLGGRYIDPTGTVQGPFSASDMSDWYKAGYLKDLDLPVVGHVRTLTPLYSTALAGACPRHQRPAIRPIRMSMTRMHQKASTHPSVLQAGPN